MQMRSRHHFRPGIDSRLVRCPQSGKHFAVYLEESRDTMLPQNIICPKDLCVSRNVQFKIGGIARVNFLG